MLDIPWSDPAVVAAVAGVLGAVLGVFGKYLADRYFLDYRLKAEHRAAERKKLRELIGKYHGRLLEAAVDWDRRMGQLYKNEDGHVEHHLDVGQDKRTAGDRYLFRSYVYRFLALCALARRFEKEAFFIDARSDIAKPEDFSFLRFTKAFLWVMTAPEITPDDGFPGRDHFLNDDFRPMLDSCYPDPDQLNFDIQRFGNILESDDSRAPFDHVLQFFDGLRRSDDVFVEEAEERPRPRYRYDRLVALHLLVMAFINEVGYSWQAFDDDEFEEVAKKFSLSDERDRLLNGIKSLRFGEDAKEIKRVVKALTRIQQGSVSPGPA